MRWLPSAALQPRLSEVLGHSDINVVLLDFDLGDEQGNHFISSARQSGYTGRILMVTAGMSAKESSAALKLGASGILLKHNSPAPWQMLFGWSHKESCGSTRKLSNKWLTPYKATSSASHELLRNVRIKCSGVCLKDL